MIGLEEESYLRFFIFSGWLNMETLKLFDEWAFVGSLKIFSSMSQDKDTNLESEKLSY